MSRNFLLRAQLILVAFGALYIAAVCLLFTPFFQSHALYLNAVRVPWFANFDVPERYGLAPNKTLNLKIHTPDNETLGAWFILSDAYYHSLPAIPSELVTHVPLAIQSYPTILFLHGNAATRAFHVRVQHYKAYTSRLSVNVLAIDYRGFADSTGQPSEAGLIRDARAAWDWLIAQGTRGEDILIVGHSLGTGVASQLVVELAGERIECRGVVLLSPFSSIREVLNTYHILRLVPLMKPLAMIPWAPNIITWALGHKFDSLSVVPKIKASVLIAHAEDDYDIPYIHSEVLFDAFLEPYLPSVPLPKNPLALSHEEWTELSTKQEVRDEKRKELVTHTDLTNFGTIDKFVQEERIVLLVKTLAGRHDYLGTQEGVQDVIRTTFGLI